MSNRISNDLLEAIRMLEESEARFRKLLEFAPDAFFQGDSEGNLIALNRKSIKLTGYTRNELLRMNMRDLFGEKMLQKVPLRFDLLNKGKTVTAERKLLQKNGDLVDIEMKSVKMPDGTYLSLMRDISKRKKIDEALKESEERYKLAFNTSPDAVNINKMDGTYIDINEGFIQATGYTRKEVIGVSSVELEIWAIPADREKMVSELKKRGRVDDLETVFRAKDGQLITGLMSARIIHLNREPHILSITRDITKRKRLEEELLAAKEKAEESDRLKTLFLNNMSHEIRTPLNAIIGFSNLLSEEELTHDEKIRYREIVEQSGTQLLTIISDIIDISQIESKQVKLRRGDHNLNGIMNNLYLTFSKNTTEGVNLVLKNGIDDEDLVIRTDKNRLIQVLSNLLENARKFTRSGTIEFGYDLLIDGSFRFYVSDTGIGIPEEHHDRIFDRFRQVDFDNSTTRSGTGLGLSIAKGLVELFNGRIGVNSTPGKGSTFWFTIPGVK